LARIHEFAVPVTGDKPSALNNGSVQISCSALLLGDDFPNRFERRLSAINGSLVNELGIVLVLVNEV